MLGVGIRSFELARALTAVGEVTLAGVGDASGIAGEMSMLAYQHEDPIALKAAIRSADVVVSQAQPPRVASWIARSGARFIADLYDPEVFENLELFSQSPERFERLWLSLTVDRLTLAIRSAHHIICASERQRDLWLGTMVAERVIDLGRYQSDPTMERTVAVVPFGVADEAPRADPALGVRARFPELAPEHEIVLWNGGLWSWLDPQSAIRAIGLLAERRPSIRFVTMGASTHRAGVAAAEQARALARELGLLDRIVYMNDRWVPYGERASWLLEADCAVSCHTAHLETRFAFRTRLLDCFWAGLPIVCTQGDELAELVQRDRLGMTAAIGDVEGLAAGIESVLDNGRASYAPALAAAADAFAWNRVTAPLCEMAARGRASRLRTPAPRPGELARSTAQRTYRRGLRTIRRIRP